MSAAIPVGALIIWRKLAAAEDLVSLAMRLDREHLVNRAGVDQERRLRGLDVFLYSFATVVSDRVRQSGIEAHKPGDHREP